jgi:hypothetical protein
LRTAATPAGVSSAAPSWTTPSLKTWQSAGTPV